MFVRAWYGTISNVGATYDIVSLGWVSRLDEKRWSPCFVHILLYTASRGQRSHGWLIEQFKAWTGRCDITTKQLPNRDQDSINIVSRRRLRRSAPNHCSLASLQGVLMYPLALGLVLLVSHSPSFQLGPQSVYGSRMVSPNHFDVC